MDTKVYKEEAEQIKALIDKFNLGQGSENPEEMIETESSDDYSSDHSFVWVLIIIVVLIIGSIVGLTYWMLN